MHRAKPEHMQASSKTKIRLNTLEKAVLVSFILAALLSMLGFKQECEDISGRVLRLHVLANSDAEEDQQLKLKVRDRILEEAAGVLDTATDRVSAEKTIAPYLDRLRLAAEDEIARHGYAYEVGVELTHMYFNTRYYENVTLPAGMYDAVRVTIGEGKGQNWWCVLFPPMCLSAASEQQELEAVLTPEESDIVEQSQQYEVRFKVVEWFESAWNWFRSLGGEEKENVSSQEPSEPAESGGTASFREGSSYGSVQ